MDWRGFTGYLLLTSGVLGSGLVFGADAVFEIPDSLTSEDQASKRDLPWSTEEIFGNIGVPSHISAAVDTSSGDLFLVYYDASAGGLMYATTNVIPGYENCGPGNTWYCYEIYPYDNVGKYCSIAVRRNPNDSEAVRLIPFYDVTNERLMYRWHRVGGTSTVALEDWHADTARTGMYTAAEIDSDDTLWIAYQNESYGPAFGTHRMVANRVGYQNGNCGTDGADDWNCEELFSNGFAQSFSSTGMALDLQGRPVVAYYDDHENYPVVARYLGPGGGGGCGNSGDWKCYTVRPRDGDTDAGRHVVPFVDPDGRLTLYYQNSHRHSLEKATYLGATGQSNCGFNSTGTIQYEWKCETIDSMDGTLMSRGIDVAADRYGYPIVAYQFVSDPGPGALAVARPVASPEVDSGGGCLPVAPSWSCDIIDGGGSYLSEAFSVSIATTPSGAAFIAYDEVDNYPYPAEHNLKLATMPGAEVFSDGFEGDNTSAWSVTVP